MQVGKSPKCLDLGHSYDGQIDEKTRKIVINQKFSIANGEIKIKFNLTIATRPVILTVDTGSMLSLLSANVIHPRTIIYKEQNAKLMGIANSVGPTATMGLVYGSFLLNNIPLSHEFQVCDSQVNLTTDGLLGLDFLYIYQANINLLKQEITYILPPNHNLYEPNQVIQKSEVEKIGNGSENLSESQNNTSKTTNEKISINKKDIQSKINEDRQKVERFLEENQDLKNLFEVTVPNEEEIEDYELNQLRKQFKELISSDLGNTSSESSSKQVINHENVGGQQGSTVPTSHQENETSAVIENVEKASNLFSKRKADLERLQELVHAEQVDSYESIDVEPINKNPEYKVRLLKTLEDKRPDGQIIQAKEETMLKVRIPTDRNLVCYSTEILPGVWTRDTIFPVKNNIGHIAIKNMNNTPVNIYPQDHDIRYEFAENFHIFSNVHLKDVDTNSKINYIQKNLKLEHCSDEEKIFVQNLYTEFNDIFYIPGDKLSHTDLIEHKIQLKEGVNPVYTKQYRLPQSSREEVNRQVDALEAMGVIENSFSKWNNPVLLVDKKENAKGEKSKRLVVDFRNLNQACKVISTSNVLIENIIDELGGSKYFSTLDVQGAYYQIPLHKDSRELTAFTTHNRKMQFRRMPMGLASSSVTFQHAINKALGEILNNGALAYLDDIIVYSKTFTEHINLLRSVFEKLRKHNFKLKIEKCDLVKKEISYLGFIISEEGTLPCPKNKDAIKNYPQPTSVTEVQKFLGCCNYYRKYIKGYARISRPLVNLLRKDVPFIFSNSCIEAFTKLKEELLKPSLLALPNFDETFYLCVDASSEAIGGVLSNQPPPNNRPICFISKSLNPVQQRYSSIEKELMAIVYAIENLRHYLYGRTFVLYTDCKPLLYVMKNKNINGRLYRWKLSLLEYDFKIVHIPGDKNLVADALSRIKIPGDGQEMITTNFNDPLSLEELLRKENITNIFQALTRNKARELELLNEANATPTEKQNPTNTGVKKKLDNPYLIKEENRILYELKDFDHLFYIFNSSKCQMRTQLEIKLKKKLNFADQATPYQLLKLDENRTIIIMPSIIRNEEQIERARIVINEILQMSLNNSFEDIAVNVDFADPQSYFKFKSLYREIFNGSNVLTTVYLNNVIELKNIEDINEILYTYHKSPLSGHCGKARTIAKIRKHFYWHNMNKDIAQYIKDCTICEKTKVTKKTHSDMVINSQASKPMERVYIDLCGPLPTNSNPLCTDPMCPYSEQTKYIFTAVCDLTKYLIAVPLPDATALSSARAFVDNVILKHGFPDSILTDNGSNFISELFTEVTRLLKVKKLLTTPYRPSTNLVERQHRTLNQYLRAFTSSEPEEWPRYLKYATFTYNNTPNSVTKYSPHELIYGYPIEIPTKFKTKQGPSYTYGNLLNELNHGLRYKHSVAEKRLIESKEKNKIYYDKNSNPLKLKVNDLVMKENKNKTHKYDNVWIGPYRVEKVLSPVTVIIRKGRKSEKIHIDQLKLSTANYGESTPPEIIQN